MSNEFKGLDATEKAGFEAALNRDRRRAAQIASELRKKKPEHFVDKLAPADLGDFLDRLQSTIETGLKDLFGGAISGIVSIVYCVSYAAFIFRVRLHHGSAMGSPRPSFRLRSVP